MVSFLGSLGISRENLKILFKAPTRTNIHLQVRPPRAKLAQKVFYFKFDGGRPEPQLIALNCFLQIVILRPFRLAMQSQCDKVARIYTSLLIYTSI